MDKIIKDNFGLIMVSVDTTINELQSFLKELKDSDLKDSPSGNIERTISAYQELLQNLRADNISDMNKKQIKAILEHRLRVLNVQKEKIDTTVPLINNLLENLS